MIGIFDSGLGGLTVARAVMSAMPEQKIIYFGDTARGPYGNKPPEIVAQYASENTRFLLDKKAKAIVIGCNTASAVAGQQLRREFAKVPIFEVISPAVREALRVSQTGKIGVIGTRTTIQSGAYQKWLRICARACPLFVPLVESGKIIHPVTYDVARQYLEPLRRNGVDTIILGCTHYPFLKPVIADIMGKEVRLVDPAETVARELLNYFITPPTSPYLKGRSMLARPPLKVRGDRGVMNIPQHQFYVSKKTPRFQELAERWLGMPIELKMSATKRRFAAS